MVTLVLALPLALVMLSDGQQATAFATIVSSAIAGGVMLVTQQSAAKRAVQSAQLTSRTDIEKEAFDRASGYYKDAMDRQHAEITEQRTEIHELDGKVTLLNARVRQLEHEAEVDKANHRKEVDLLKADLEAAKKALALKYPDE